MKKCVLIAALLMNVATSFGADYRLIDAAKKSDIKTVRLLIAQHVDVNATEPDGSTALHWAVQGDNIEIVDALLNAAANATSSNRYNITPLSLACEYGQAAVAARLLAAGAASQNAASEALICALSGEWSGNASRQFGAIRCSALGSYRVPQQRHGAAR